MQSKELSHSPSFERYYSWALQKNHNIPHWEILDHWLDLPIEKQSNSEQWTLPHEGELSHAPEMRQHSDEPQFKEAGEDCEECGCGNPNKVHIQAGEDEEQVHVNAKCPQCSHVFDYISQPEAGMGYVSCPKCEGPVNQGHCIDEDEQESGQMVTNDQTTQMISTQQPTKEYREEEEQPQNPNQQQQQTQASTPEEQQLRQRVAQLAAKNPQLGLTVNYTGKQNNLKDSQAWYVFSKQTETTPLGIQAKKWGGYSSHELNDMVNELDTMGEEGIKNYFSTTKKT
jgi:phage FluMu protein Com